MRCDWAVGCPAELRPLEDEGHAANSSNEMPTAKGIFSRAWRELMPEEPVPEVIAVSCCSQFAVTIDMVRNRPLADYVRFRNWLLETLLEDALSGRVFGFLWHSKFVSYDEAETLPQPTCVYSSLLPVLFCFLVSFLTSFAPQSFSARRPCTARRRRSAAAEPSVYATSPVRRVPVKGGTRCLRSPCCLKAGPWWVGREKQGSSQARWAK